MSWRDAESKPLTFEAFTAGWEWMEAARPRLLESITATPATWKRLQVTFGPGRSSRDGPGGLLYGVAGSYAPAVVVHVTSAIDCDYELYFSDGTTERHGPGDIRRGHG